LQVGREVHQQALLVHSPGKIGVEEVGGFVARARNLRAQPGFIAVDGHHLHLYLNTRVSAFILPCEAIEALAIIAAHGGEKYGCRL
jgi:hypothetical protein